jgi:hypothetical protein
MQRYATSFHSRSPLQHTHTSTTRLTVLKDSKRVEDFDMKQVCGINK